MDGAQSSVVAGKSNPARNVLGDEEACWVKPCCRRGPVWCKRPKVRGVWVVKDEAREVKLQKEVKAM